MDNLLEVDPVWKVRSNHSLEHATLHVLSTKVTRARVSGLSDAGGFWLLGRLPTDLVLESAQEALKRLQDGEKGLAMHEHCGSNLVPSIVVSGGLAWLAMAGTGDSLRKKTRRIPLAVIMALLGYEAAKPVGPLLQEKATSTDHFDGMLVREVRVYKPYDFIIHRVITEFKVG
ncbi:MAG TPA: hypothetical protein DCK95_01090 [Anaerolineaceae bacterium]|uniref:Uncharacterized protein n=1 Tax=Anaerolinea thermophila TaxID=167964 RepID=A0A101FYT1_9CHLR|nr:MAG: hypothetical protein XD73_0289 [Anaerolinea thermophila]HAF60904.1 hypothetical protein [Anaerolineaceae bacterium]